MIGSAAAAASTSHRYQPYGSGPSSSAIFVKMLKIAPLHAAVLKHLEDPRDVIHFSRLLDINREEVGEKFEKDSDHLALSGGRLLAETFASPSPAVPRRFYSGLRSLHLQEVRIPGGVREIEELASVFDNLSALSLSRVQFSPDACLDLGDFRSLMAVNVEDCPGLRGLLLPEGLGSLSVSDCGELVRPTPSGAAGPRFFSAIGCRRLDPRRIATPTLECCSIRECNLRRLDLGRATRLRHLDLSDNRLVELDLSACANLGELVVERNRLETIGLSRDERGRAFGRLRLLKARDNHLKELPEMHNFFHLVHADFSRNLIEGKVTDPGMPFVTDRPMSLDLSQNPRILAQVQR